ncbi:MAG: GGDEF domain-containing protein [Deltaproteobacteria bacterium]|nr:MAG: GGDEF domain-containing protein [Deltaproteobacteria bacterium]
MTISTKLSQSAPGIENADQIERVMAELAFLKRQSEKLEFMNQLHARMAGILQITDMIEAYSVWLMPHVRHELIGYNNKSNNKKHLFCSGHGPNRRAVVAFAEELIRGRQAAGSYSDNAGYYAHKWIFETSDDAGIFLIIKQGQELSGDEVDFINDSLEILADCLHRAIEYEDLFERASRDALTGLLNRRVFEDRITGMVEGARRYQRPLTVAAMDLDRFKVINDKLGHQAGDEALKSVALALNSAIRSSDLLIRMGGDEFILLLPDTDLENAGILAERLGLAVEELDIWADQANKLGVSIGLAQLGDEESIHEWMERADDNLYHAKAQR